MKTRRRRGAITEQDINKEVDNCIPEVSRVRVTFLEQVDYKMEMEQQDESTGSCQYSNLTKQTTHMVVHAQQHQPQHRLQQDKNDSPFKKKLRRYSGKTKQQDFQQLK